MGAGKSYKGYEKKSQSNEWQQSWQSSGSDWHAKDWKAGYADKNGVDTKWYWGWVKSFSTQTGYGFVSCDETHAIYGKDCFLGEEFVGQVTKEQEVQFTIRLNEKGQPVVDK